VITPDHSEPLDSGFIRANAKVSHVVGETLYQVRMGYAGIQLALGDSFEYEVAIDTPLAVTTTGAVWAGEPLTAEAARALLPLLGADVVSARVAADGTLHLVIGEAAIEVGPNDHYEAWQLRGPRNLLIVCSPGAITSPCSNLTRKSDVVELGFHATSDGKAAGR
jgi:hypothetical protein